MYPQLGRKEDDGKRVGTESEYGLNHGIVKELSGKSCRCVSYNPNRAVPFTPSFAPLPPFAPASPAWSRGRCAAEACRLEASAEKPGNVHPGAAFIDLSHAELVAAGVAIAPAFDRAPIERLGATILAAVRASSCVTRSNANLGIVLALAPVAAAAEEEPRRSITAQGIATVLGRLGPLDAADVWEAIRLANPGGMGKVSAADLHDPPPADLRAAMAAAAPHDQIAKLWTDGYASFFEGLVEDLLAELGSGHSLGDAIVRGYLRQLAREPDSLITRRHGAGVAGEVSRGAAHVLRAGAGDWKNALATFDRSLRVPVKINPGTTADLVATALFILLWEGRLQDFLGAEPALAAAQRSPSSSPSESSPDVSSPSSAEPS